MKVVDLAQLCASHNERVRAIDPDVAAATLLPWSEVDIRATAAVAGVHAAGVVRTHRFAETDDAALWGPLVRHVVHLQAFGEFAQEQVLATLLREVTSESSWTGDAGITLTWPSRDASCVAALVQLGMAPLTVLGMRVLRDQPGDRPSHQIRRAEADHLDAIADYALQLHRVEMRLGVLPDRQNLPSRIRDELAAALDDPVNRILVAVEGSSVVGFVQAQLPRGAWIEGRVTPRPAGYMSRLFVDPACRGCGVGTSLAVSIENELRENGAHVALLHYSAHNPDGAPMWIRRGYRSVLTTWSLRPPPGSWE